MGPPKPQGHAKPQGPPKSCMDILNPTASLPRPPMTHGNPMEAGSGLAHSTPWPPAYTKLKPMMEPTAGGTGVHVMMEPTAGGTGVHAMMEPTVGGTAHSRVCHQQQEK